MSKQLFLPEITAESKSENYFKQFFNKCELHQDFLLALEAAQLILHMARERHHTHVHKPTTDVLVGIICWYTPLQAPSIIIFRRKHEVYQGS